MGDGMMTGGAMMVMGATAMLLTFVVLVGGVVWITHALTRGRGRDHRAAVDLLDRRYAQGEVDRDEYVQRRDDLVVGGSSRRGDGCASSTQGAGPA